MKNSPLIPETGIIADYYNEISPLVLAIVEYELSNGDMFDIFHHVRKYEERFPKEKYGNVKTRKNSEAVQGLDILVDRLNILISEKSRNMKRYKDVLQEMDYLILGRRRNLF
jgi:hypothetical protein